MRIFVPLFLLALAPHHDAAPPFGERLIAELNAARVERGLSRLELDADLAAVAQARVDAMVREGWFALASPTGQKVEDDLDARHYAFALVAEKLLRSAQEPAELAFGWKSDPEKNADSLFQPEVDHVGVGVASSGGGRLIDIVLARAAAAGTAPGRASVSVGDPGAAIAALEELVTQRRKAAGRAPLRSDSLLTQSAQQHAEALLAALEKGQGPESIASLSDRYTELERARRGADSGIAQSFDAFKQREILAETGSRRGKVAGLVSILVVDAPTAGIAMRTMEQTPETSDFLDPSLRSIGIGLATSDDGGVRRVAWVLALRDR